MIDMLHLKHSSDLHVHEGLGIKKHPNVFLECMVSALQSYNVVNVSLLSPED